ncbi:MAG: T9SS type A sorting domain-containing protein [bacterium]
MKNKIVVFLVLLVALSTSFTRAQTPFPVGFFPKPIATVTGTQSICAGQSAQITITITGGSIWGIVWNDGTTQHVVNNITTSPYILTLVNPTQTTVCWVDSVWNEYGCSSVGNGVALVTVNPLPQIFNISTTNTHFCQGGAGASLTISGSEVGKSYQIKNGLTNVGAPQIGTGTTLSFSGITTSGVPLTVVATNTSTGCTSTMNGTVTFIMDPLPVAAGTITGLTTLCEGQVVTYTIPTITYATTYLWTIPNGTIISGQGTPSITVVGNIPVTTNISVFGQNACGVGQPASLSVTVNPKPVATITSNPSNATICMGQSLYLAANGGTSATWYPGSISGLTYTPTPTFNTMYTSVVSNVYGCSDTATINVTVNPLPTVTVSTTPFGGNICNGTSATITASGSTATYLWNDNFVGSVHTVTPGTTTTYTVTGTNSFGCTASASATITVNPLPTATITPSSANICIGQSASFTAAGGVSYLWSTNMTTPSISVTPTTSTTYAVTVTNAFGCTTIANVAVNVNPLPTAAITPTAPSICQGATANLTASGGGTYLWSTGATTANVAVTPSTTTMYSVTVTSISGCVAIANATVTVNPLPLSAGTVSGLTSVCQNGTATYSTTTIANASTYVWAVPNVATIVSGQGTTQITVAFNGSTSGTISVFGQNACGGGLPSSLSVTVNAAPSLNATANPTDICIGMSTTLTASGTGNSFLWNTGAITQAITVSPIANTTYYVTATGSNGCVTTGNVAVTVHALPNASIVGLPNAVCTDQNTVALVGSPTGGTFSGFAVGGNLFYPSVAGPGTVTITYTVTDGYGCIGSAVDYITVNPLPVVSFNSPPGPINVGTPAFDMNQFVYPPNGTFTGPGMIGSMFNPAIAGPGTITITYTYTNPATGCSSGQTQYIPVGTVGIDEVNAAVNAISIYPNPASNNINLSGINIKQIKSLSIINLLGEVVYTTSINAENMMLDLSGLATGTYFIRFIDVDGFSISKKIMKNE